jgi:crotonobetainyl-CoA:carnitine CoA-transferase CaiB-like acyl-CoA transferase
MASPAPGPFEGVRILELTSGQAGRTAGMLLADLGADVVRSLPGGEPRRPWTAEQLCWDRGKRFVASAGPAELQRLAGAAHVVLSDARPGELEAAGLDAAALAGPGLVHAWLPPYAARGRWAGLPADPLLLDALGGFASHHPAVEDRPVASVVPVVSATHGALAAGAVAAALVGVRTTGHGRSVVVSGLHAMGACLGSMMLEGLDVERVFSPGSRLPGSPNFRAYQGADGRWLHLAALTPGFFLAALDVLDRMDVMVLDGVDGEFTNLLVPEIGVPVGVQLERSFATRPRDAWLEAFAAAGVPAAPVSTRAEWLDGDIVAATGGRLDLDHADLGPVVLPGVPVRLPATPARVRHLPGDEHVVAAAGVWPGVVRLGPASTADRTAAARPLAGLQVVDLSTFLAAPFASALLADHGAEVVKVETTSGDPYRIFTASYASVNQAKTACALDLRSAAGRDALLDLVRAADVLVDNLRPASMERLDLGDDVLSAAGPRLVRCSVSAYGRTGPYAELPGFDPVLQALSGLADAQGGTSDPVATTAPVHDVATGALAALGVLGALFARAGGGSGQHVTVALATTSTFLQAAEMTTFAGRAPTRAGGRDYAGPTEMHRYHRASDGWVAVAATTPEHVRELLAAAGVADVGGLRTALAAQPVEHWVSVLAACGVPACPVLPRAGALHDPFLVENDFSHVVRDPLIGRLRVVRAFADWPDTPPSTIGCCA